MIIKYSDALGSSSKAFKQKGVFDGFIGIDTHLYIDPHLLSKSDAPEMVAGSKTFRKYFIDTIKFLKESLRQMARFGGKQLSDLHFLKYLNLDWATLTQIREVQ